jgi:tRNA threonylcarbamoyladenosine biosynthesis protein TsaB
MACILCLETSTEVCSAAIAEDGKIVDFREDLTGQNHSRLLTAFISELLTANGMKASDFDAVAVSEGPGSYTGLRIGVSAAKGICYGAEIPLIAISPLEAMASYVIENKVDLDLIPREKDRLVPMIDARRMEVFMAEYDWQLNPISPVEARIIDAESFHDSEDESLLLFFGNGSAKCKTVLSDTRFRFIDGIIASSRNMAVLANHKFKLGNFVDVAYFEPFYLKDFIATVPKNSVLPGR